MIDVELPPGNYELIGISSEITEEQADIIVKEYFDFFKQFYKYKLVYLPSKRLLKIALTSKGLKGRYAILKTIK